jgi:RNA polymerase sigma-70 factor, ECF subfamily
MPRLGNEPKRAPNASRESFERYFRAYYAAVLAFAMRRIRGRADAEDVTASTFAIAWRRRERIPDRALPWLYAIAIRVLANHRRSTQRRARLAHRIVGQAQTSENGTDPAHVVGERTAFFNAFSRLSESDQEVLRLVAWEGLDTTDAARVLGCTPGAYRVRLFRARRALAKHLSATGHLAQGRPADADRGPVEEVR